MSCVLSATQFGQLFAAAQEVVRVLVLFRDRGFKLLLSRMTMRKIATPCQRYRYCLIEHCENFRGVTQAQGSDVIFFW